MRSYQHKFSVNIMSNLMNAFLPRLSFTKLSSHSFSEYQNSPIAKYDCLLEKEEERLIQLVSRCNCT